MTTYLAARFTVKDMEILGNYSKKAAPIVAKFGGKILFKGNADSIFTGSASEPNLVVFEFPNKEAIDNFYNSQEYQEIIPLRNEGAEMAFSSHEAL